MTTPTSNLPLMKRFLLLLKNAEPEGYEHFCKQFEIYTQEHMTATCNAPQEHILTQQGRAQQCLALLRMFRECDVAPKSQQPPSQP